MATDSSVRNFTRGGQTLLHNLRMTNQIIQQLTKSCLGWFILMSLAGMYFFISEYQFYVVKEWCWAHLMLLLNEQSLDKFINPNGVAVKVYPIQLVQSALIQKIIQNVTEICLSIFILSSIVALMIFMISYRWLRVRGEKQTETRQLRGDEIVDWREVNRMIIQSGKISGIQLSGLSLPEGFETRHMLIHGTTGCGKSLCIRELLDQVRKRGDKVIIYDKGYDYIRHYYREGQDIILNPLHPKTAPWHLWHECRDAADFDSLAAALMPLPPGTNDPFWISAARTIFSAAARQMQDNPKRSAALLLKALLTADLQTMSLFLKGTEAETLVSEKIEKTAISIKSVLTTYLKSLQYVVDQENAFSIRRWIQDDNDKNWLFISSVSDKHETLKPLISMWLDIAENALMSLLPSRERRIWMILDELPSLQRLPYLPEAFAEARKFGGCLVAGMQSIAQLRKIYGNHAAEEISNLCNTRIFFRDPSYETAQWASRELGESETEETKENISYSESAMRSGISISNQRYKQQIISASEIMHLNDLEAFVRLPGQFPLTRIKLKPH